MRRVFLMLLLVAVFFIRPAGAASIPSKEVSLLPGNEFPGKIPDLRTIKVRDFEKLTGKKLSLKEKVAFKIFQWKIRKGLHTREENKKDKGKAAMILGIIGIASLFIPYVSLISIPCTVLALVFGYQAKKANPNDSKAKTAIILGWVTVGLYALAILLIIAILASWGWGWG